MENRLRFVLKPSLEKMALRRIAVALCSHPDILASIAPFRFLGGFDLANLWDSVRVIQGNERDWPHAVLDRVSALGLPESLRKQMVPTVKAVGSEICTWKWIHGEYLGGQLPLACLRKLCWTSAGAVDYTATARRLVRCDALDVGQRFKLACRYCLGDRLPLLFEDLTDLDKINFCYDTQIETPHLQSFLPYIVAQQSQISSRGGLPRNSFEKAALCGNKTLTELCFSKLKKEKREESLVRTAKEVIRCRDQDFGRYDGRRGKLTEVFCCLLSLMTREEQMAVFRECPCEVMRCFLDWPWQDLLSDVADLVWALVPESQYGRLMDTVGKSRDHAGYYFPSVFQDLFVRSPRAFRKRFVYMESHYHYCLAEFFRNEDTETIIVILRNVDAADRVSLVSSNCTLEIIHKHCYKWRVMEAFLRAAELSREDKETLKEKFIDYADFGKYRNSIDLRRKDFGEFFEFLEESAEEPEKPDHEERTETSSVKTKKIRLSN